MATAQVPLQLDVSKISCATFNVVWPHTMSTLQATDSQSHALKETNIDSRKCSTQDIAETPAANVQTCAKRRAGSAMHQSC